VSIVSDRCGQPLRCCHSTWPYTYSGAVKSLVRERTSVTLVVVFGLLVVTATVVGLMFRLVQTSEMLAADMDFEVFAHSRRQSEAT
jgi:hypothetical protein